jgi:hypothetical protein
LLQPLRDHHPVPLLPVPRRTRRRSRGSTCDDAIRVGIRAIAFREQRATATLRREEARQGSEVKEARASRAVAALAECVEAQEAQIALLTKALEIIAAAGNAVAAASMPVAGGA